MNDDYEFSAIRDLPERERERVQQLLRSAPPVSMCLAEAGTPAGIRKVADYLNARPYPHYEADPKSPSLLVSIEDNGCRTRGRFVNRQFVPVSAA